MSTEISILLQVREMGQSVEQYWFQFETVIGNQNYTTS